MTVAQRAEHYGIIKKSYDSIVLKGTGVRKRKYDLIETDLYLSLEYEYIEQYIENGSF